MRFSKMIVVAAGMAVIASTVAAQQAPMPAYKGIGSPATKQEIQAEDISVSREGKGLPPGSGSAKEGAGIYVAKCAVCHGMNGEGAKIGPALVTDKNAHESLTTMKPVRSLGAYWPYATMVWDYIHRAMPRNQGGTLTPNEVYSLTAFILYKNGIIQEGDVLDQKTLPNVHMPNRDGFVPARLEDIPDEHKRGCKQGICP
jgi:S-disulfanyl-L-cysteine oxidoreductase SoxD